jgi:hypothetical protein
MWDNRNSKRSAKAPDFKCKDKQNCDGAIWLDKKPQNGAPQSNGNGPAPAAPSRPPLTLDSLMRASLIAAQGIANDLFTDGETVGADHDIVLRIAQSIFIARTDDKGILKAEKEAFAKAAELQKLLQEKEAAERRAAEERARATSAPYAGSEGDAQYYGGEALPF